MIFRRKGMAYLLLSIVLSYSNATLVLAADDSVPPVITAVEVSDVTETTMKVHWKTDEKSDSLVNYGLREDYGIIRKPVADKIDHEILLEGLEPGRKYHFRVVSSDLTGNQGISADYQVETKGQASSQSSASTPTQTVIDALKTVTTIAELKKIQEEVTKAVKGVTDLLAIVGPPTVIPETTTALVQWTTDRESSSEVLFAPSSGFSGTTYTFSQSSLGAPTRVHEVRIIGLDPFTEYHFKVRSTDGVGVTGESNDYTFTTKASLPQIKNLRVVKVEETSATLAWDTTVPAKALIEYQNLTTGEQNSKGRPTLASTQQMKIDGLTLGARYVAFVTAENAGGDRVKSSPITFITVKDTAPPLISNVTNESTIFPGSEARIQTIISWLTDEQAYCKLAYREGVTAAKDAIVIEPQDKSFTEHHVEVITDFAPATVYKFALICADQVGNSVQSEDFVLFTPAKEKNIIDIIIENFQGTFGWVKNIGKH